jgi:hypothetical protein
MAVRPIALTSAIAVTLTLSALIRTHAQTGPETFTATAAVKTAGAASATAPMTIVISRKMSQGEAEKLTAAFGGAPALRKALANVPETGSIQLGSGKPTPTRLTLERTTEKGRLLTIVADQPILFLGAGMAGAKPKDGYDFAILDIEVNASGTGSGMFAPAAKVTVKQGTFVVEDYAVEAVRLTDVKKVK